MFIDNNDLNHGMCLDCFENNDNVLLINNINYNIAMQAL